MIYTQAGSSLTFEAFAAYLQSLVSSSGRTELATSVLPTLVRAIYDISLALRTNQFVGHVGAANSFGDQQLNVDVAAHEILYSACKGCRAIATASSEEDPHERPLQTENATCGTKSTEKYTVAYDPLDGSSIVASNWTVGAIIGVWDGTTALVKSPRQHLVAALLGVFGPRATAIVALNIPGVETPACFELGLEAESIMVVQPKIYFTSPPFAARYFAPANLRAAAEDEKYKNLVLRFINDKYTLRYSGGLVPDVVHALVKGHGIYISPTTPKSKAKLRRLYELCPVAFVIECAGGKAIESASGRPLLDIPITACNEMGGIVCGTADEVDAAWEALK